MRYVVLSVTSDAEAERLIQDLTEHPGEPLRTPHWSNAVHATLASAAPGPVYRTDTDAPVLRSA
jgi:hypothetical protein